MKETENFIKEMIEIHSNESLVFHLLGIRGIGKTTFLKSKNFFGNSLLHKKIFINCTQISGQKNNFIEVIKNSYLSKNWLRKICNRLFLNLSIILSAILLVSNILVETQIKSKNETITIIRWSIFGIYLFLIFIFILFYKKYDNEKDFVTISLKKYNFFIFDDLDRVDSSDKDYIIKNIQIFKEHFNKGNYFILVDKQNEEIRDPSKDKTNKSLDNYKYIDYFTTISYSSNEIENIKMEIFSK